MSWKRNVNTLLMKVLPKNNCGDRVIAWVKFLFNHKRLPNKDLFNDRLYFLKSSGELRDPLRVFVSDKEYVKIFVRSIVGEGYNVPTYKVLQSFDEVKEYEFPYRCCIKPTHASKEVIIREAGEEVDYDKIFSWFSMDFYEQTRQANYCGLRPKVIVEPLVFDEGDVTDYRIFCDNGKPKLISVDVGKYSGYTRDFFDPEWHRQSFSLHYPRSADGVVKPDNLDEMLGVASSLAVYFDFIRIDIYSDGDKCMVGEITNCHANAGQRFIPLSGEVEATKALFGS